MNFAQTLWLLIPLTWLLASSAQPILIKLAAMNGWYDLPDERKIHKQAISALGGIGIFLTSWFSFYFGFGLIDMQWFVLFVSSAILFLMCIVDDVKPIPSLFKLFTQIGLGLWICHSGIHLDLAFFTGLEGIGGIAINYGITVFFILLVMNAINFIDGVNGLAGSICFSQLMGLAILAWWVGLTYWAAFALLIGPAILGFLRFNFGGEARIFMGDNGSTFLGLIIAVLVIKLSNVFLTQVEFFPYLPYLFILVSIPIIDLLKVVILRMKKGYSPFRPDRTHLHHLMLNKGFNPVQICVIVLAFTIGNLLIAFSLFPSHVFLCLPLYMIQILGLYVYISAPIPQEVDFEL